MSWAEALSWGFDAMDMIGACLVLGHSRYARNILRKVRNSCGAGMTVVCQPVAPGEIDTPFRVEGGKLMDGDWDDGLRDLVEPVPVRDTFVTGMCKIEQLGSGDIVRGWFYAEEAGDRILRAKLVIPLACAAIMNMHGTHVFTKMLRNRPHIARLIRS